MFGSTENSSFSMTSVSVGWYSMDASVSTGFSGSLETFMRNTYLRMFLRSLAKFVCNWSATPAMHTYNRWIKSSLDLKIKKKKKLIRKIVK